MKAKTYDRIFLAILGALALGVVLVAVGPSRLAKFFASDAAPGWIQAFGAVIALGVAVWLPERARRDNRTGKHRLAAHFVMRMAVMYKLIRNDCTTQDFAAFAVRRSLLMEEARTGDALASMELDGVVMSIVLAARLRAIEAYHLSAGHTALGNWSHWETFFDKRHQQALTQRDRLRTMLRLEPTD